ncbi:hypothetical protein CU097_013859 [Rhizopus azygosporus]|uniref:C3H1-type domain-containing protein n=1 Tax=Rhizopus azygosporus TaxID=86630 RepID=A0A367K6G6_RHIAZ|nr:hypothetical protein CU097_013859 [Rhizopus azygosporus]
MLDERQVRLYKTEMCRNWQEIGSCRYGHKCRFAHGEQERRHVQRSPKYKTQICKTFHLTGTCLYGVRCVFIHDEHQDSTNRLNALATPFVFHNEKMNMPSDFMWFTPLPFDRRYSFSSSSSSSSSAVTFT